MKSKRDNWCLRTLNESESIMMRPWPGKMVWNKTQGFWTREKIFQGLDSRVWFDRWRMENALLGWFGKMVWNKNNFEIIEAECGMTDEEWKCIAIKALNRYPKIDLIR